MYVNIGINIDFMLIHTEEWIDLPGFTSKL